MNIPGYAYFITIALNIVVPPLVWFGFWHTAQTVDMQQQERRRLTTAVSLFLGIWVLLAFGLGLSGFFGPQTGQRVPNIAYTAVPLLIGGGFLIFSPTFRKVVLAAPSHWVVGIQVVRSVGVLFLILSGLGLMPAAFAGPAGWGDMITGVAAPFVAYALVTGKRWARPLALGWNLFGMADLVTAVTLGVLTSPGILQRLALGQPNTLITTFPVILIPTLAVPLMMLLHITSLYQLLRRHKLRQLSLAGR